MYTESKEKRRCLNEMTDRHTYVSKHQNSDALRKFKEKPYQLKNKEKNKAPCQNSHSYRSAE